MTVSAPARPRGLAALAALERQLPADELLLDADAQAPFLADASGLPADGAPLAVVAARSVESVQAAARVAHAHRLPLAVRGSGTGLAGGALAPAGGIVLALHALDGIRIDPDDHVAVVGPGAITAEVDAAARAHGLMYAPDPASARWSSIGGNIATNAGGLRCVKYGVTRDAVLALEVVLADGSLLRTGHRSVKGVTGLDLASLIVGSEGTLGIVVGATLRLLPAPTAERTLVVSTDGLAHAGRAVAVVTSSGVRPSCLELLDGATLDNIDAHRGTDLRARHGAALLLVRTDGVGADAEIALLDAALRAAGFASEVLDDVEGERYAELRRTGRGPRPDRWAVGEDIAVPRSRLVDALEALEDIGRRFGLETATVAHAGDGNLHPALYAERLPGESAPPARLERAADELVRTALRLGGTLTGEHGVGRTKRRWLADEIGDAQLALQRAVKAVFDPHGILSPGGFLAADDAPDLPAKDEIPA